LTSAGHQVGLAYQGWPLSKRYGGIDDSIFVEVIPLPDTSMLTSIGDTMAEAISGYDIIHVHNEPDMLTTLALGLVGGEVPVVHDCHDLLSIRGVNGKLAQVRAFERLAIRGADGVIFVSPYQRKQAQTIYRDLDESKTEIIYSYVPTAWVPEEPLEKLSVKDGEMHLVYQGG